MVGAVGDIGLVDGIGLAGGGVAVESRIVEGVADPLFWAEPLPELSVIGGGVGVAGSGCALW